MNKQELAAKIWAGANQLRGSVSASNYKDYMLGFIFYKYLSEKEVKYLKESLKFKDEELKEAVEEDQELVVNCQNNLGYFISYEHLYSTWLDKDTEYTIQNVHKGLSAFNRLIAQNYKKVYEGIFDTLEKGLNDLGNSDANRTKNSKKLLEIIQDIPMDGKQEYDVLGFIYEFLLKNFAANAGKAGEFYTPHEASLIMSEIIADHLKGKQQISIYDPTSGSGSLLINIGRSISKYMDNPNGVKYFAQELIANTYNLTRMNLIMRDILPANIFARHGDTLSKFDWPLFEEGNYENTYEPLFVDGCCSNPPYSQGWVTDDAEGDPRFDYGIAPKTKADYAFLLHNLYHLKNDGIMTIVLPHGVLFRGGEEANIRKKLIDNNHIETIIGLPPNMFYGTGIPTIIMVLKKQRQSSDILFVDASREFVKDGNKNKLLSKHVRKIVDTVLGRKTIKHYSRLVAKDEIVNINNGNLNISKYVDSSVLEPSLDLYATMYGGIPNSEIDLLDDFWKAFPSLKSQIFSQKDIAYSDIKSKTPRKTIEDNQDVKIFVDSYKSRFKDFPDYLKKEILEKLENVSINKELPELTNKLHQIMDGIQLIDFYDGYQILSNCWNVISLDLETIQQMGLKVLKETEPIVVYKKDSKTKEIKEVTVGTEGKVLPLEFIQNKYFTSEKIELDILKSKLADELGFKDELFSSLDPDDKAPLLDEDGEINKKEFEKKLKEIKAKKKRGDVFEEDSFEDIILKIDESTKAISKIKKQIKESSKSLENKTTEKMSQLTDDEALENLSDKWFTPLLDGLINLSTEMIKQLEKAINKLNKKYETTLTQIESDLNKAEKSLSEMLDKLTGNGYDVRALVALKQLIHFDSNNQINEEELLKRITEGKNQKPLIRFEGFKGEWNYSQFDDIVARIGTGLNPRDNFVLNNGGENFYVTIKNFEHGHLYLDDECDKVDDEALKTIQARSDLQKDDILFTSIGRIGDCYLIKEKPTNWNINESVFTLRPNQNKVDPEYLFHVIHSDEVLTRILTDVTGSTFKSIKIGDLKKIIIPTSTKEEQKEIASFISQLESIITLQKEKNEKMVEIKKTLIRKMFA